MEIFNIDTRVWAVVDPLPEPVGRHRMVRDGEAGLRVDGMERDRVGFTGTMWTVDGDWRRHR